MNSRPVIMYFRQDLRLRDNPALNLAAACCQKILPLYIFDTVFPGHWQMGSAQKVFLSEVLSSLQKEIPLVIETGNPVEILQGLVQETEAGAIYWNRCYEPYARRRDQEIESVMETLGVKVYTCNGSLLIEPWEVSTNQGTPCKVFTPFWKKSLQLINPLKPAKKPKPSFYRQKGETFDFSALFTFTDSFRPAARPHLAIDPSSEIAAAIPSSRPSPSETSRLSEILPVKVNKADFPPKWAGPLKKHWDSTEKGAHRHLAHFVNSAIDDYKKLRDIPCEEGTSSLSPYLHLGLLSPSQIWHAIPNRETEGASCFINELGWREFSYHLLYHFPHLPDRSFNDKFNDFKWDDNDKFLMLWQKGLTGYPIVDAGMRQLWQIGWMHNRVRMIAASFLTKDLLIHWKRGEEWFWDTLVDADLASNAASWQWVAGTGADAAPYFRIFNPVLQGEKFDPQGDYVKKWVPELQSVPPKWIHKPWEAPDTVLREKGVVLGHHYPHPIVEHKKMREEALKRFKSLSF